MPGGRTASGINLAARTPSDYPCPNIHPKAKIQLAKISKGEVMLLRAASIVKIPVSTRRFVRLRPWTHFG